MSDKSSSKKKGEGNAEGNAEGDKANTPGNSTNVKLTKTINALTSCFDQKLEVSNNIYFFIILFILYLIVIYSYNKINEIDGCAPGKPIEKLQYQRLISGYVYWIISFILIVILKYNKINIINNLVWELGSSGKEAGIKGIAESIPVIKYFTNIASVIFSIMNVIVIVVMFITLYNIIKKTIEFISCKNTVCTVSDTCRMDSGESLMNVRYLKYEVPKECLDSDGKKIGTAYKDPNPDPDPGPKDGEEVGNIKGKLGKPVKVFIYAMIFMLIVLFYAYTVYSLKTTNLTAFVFICIYLLICTILISFSIIPNLKASRFSTHAINITGLLGSVAYLSYIKFFK